MNKKILISIIIVATIIIAGMSYWFYKPGLKQTPSDVDTRPEPTPIFTEKRISPPFDLIKLLGDKDANEFTLNLEGVDYIIVKDKVEKRRENDYSWYGKISDGDNQKVIFVIKDDYLTGTIPAQPSKNLPAYTIKSIKGESDYLLIKILK